MSVKMALICAFCSKECKSSDSRPHPNSKSKDRIHNKCILKKSLADKQSKTINTHNHDYEKQADNSKSPSQDQSNKLVSDSKVITNSSTNMVDDLIREREKLKRIEIMKKKMTTLLQVEQVKTESTGAQNSGQFFFDLKAGIAKPHEKKKYLHHKNVRDYVARYDDECFKEEALGRAYDHSGKDLNALGDSEDDDPQGNNNHHKTNEKQFPTTDDFGNQHRQKRKFDTRNDSHKTKRESRVRIDDKNPCWFCFSSDSIEKHLVVAVGRHCYLTVAKGGLTDEHMLILPINHIESINSDQMSTGIMEELERFKHSLIKYFQKQSKAVVFFERNFRSVHWQLQAVPITIEDIMLDEFCSKIRSVSRKHYDKVEYVDIPQDCLLRDRIESKNPYFYWQVEPVGQTFACQIQAGKDCFFPVQFGRMVLADPELMNCPDRIDWKKCSKEKEDYVTLVELIKQKYDDFNFTND